MTSISLWKALDKRPSTYPELNEPLEVDIVIIGGGITGITAANQLIQAGKTVAVVEAHQIGGTTTSFSTGNLYVAVQPMYQSIVDKFDVETAKTIAYSRQFAIDYIEQTSHAKNIACHFKRRPWYVYTQQNDNSRLQKEVDFLKKIDLDITYTTDLPLPVKLKKAAIMPHQARFNPLQYVQGLAEDLHKKGCYLFENTRVERIEEGTGCLVTTEKTHIKAEKVFIATHTPIGINLIQNFTAPYRSYVVAVTLKDKTYPEGHFWDLDNPPLALCTHPISQDFPELLMVAGSHHKTGQGREMQQHYQTLNTFLKKNFNVDEIVYQWSAQHYQSADKIPYIGLAHHGSKHVYMATGYFADGLVYGTLAGLMMGDILAAKDNLWLTIYNSQRKHLSAATPFLIKENVNLLGQYFKDLPLPNKASFADIKKGEGKVIEIEREKYAISRNGDNELYIVSAVCPHMKGIVNWNDAEKTWDCPCHGSRFRPNGELIEGPATRGLCKKTFREGE